MSVQSERKRLLWAIAANRGTLPPMRDTLDAPSIRAPIDIEAYHNIVIVTGAGISAPSGLRTYRGEGGLWAGQDGCYVATVEALRDEPERVWQHFGEMRKAVIAAEPNVAHRALVDAERRAPGQFTLITQNVDQLHRKAGSAAPIDIHGSLLRTRCTDCDRPPFADLRHEFPSVPQCDSCGANLRPDVVLFGESVGIDEEYQVKMALRLCDLFIAIGTSGTVAPACNYVRSADYAGARTILMNLEPMNPRNPYFHEEYIGSAETLVPALLASL